MISRSVMKALVNSSGTEVHSISTNSDKAALFEKEDKYIHNDISK